MSLLCSLLPQAAKAAKQSPQSPAGGATTPGAVVAGEGKKKKASKAKADGVVSPSGIGSAAPVSSPLGASSVTGVEGAPRAYTREQMAAIVEAFIASARANPQSAQAKRPPTFAQAEDKDRAVLKTVPSTNISILDPFPVSVHTDKEQLGFLA